MAVRKTDFSRRQPQQLALPGHDLRPIEAGRNIAAVGAGVHGDGTADAARNAAEKFHARQAGGRGMLCHDGIQCRGTRNQPIRFDRDVAKSARQADHHAGNSAIAHDQVGSRPHDGHRQMQR